MDCGHVAIRPPRRISSARDTAGLYPEARKAGDAPSGRAHCSGPGTPTKCQNRADALRAQEALTKRLRKFSLTLEPTKTKLVEFGRYAHRHASKRGRKRPETIYFLGFTLYCTRYQKGNFRIGLLTEKSRLRRALTRLQDQMRQMRHLSLQEQVNHLNQMLRGHYAYYGVAGNLQALLRVHRAVERYW